MSTETTRGTVTRGETDDRAAWTLTPLAEEERPLQMRLVELHLHDLSEVAGRDVGDDGRFVETDSYDRYGAGAGHHALLLQVAGRPAGFVLVDERGLLPRGDDRRFVAEFFVVRAHRSRGVGSAVARAVFDRYPGRWQVLQMAENTAAQTFWRRVVSAYTGGRYAERWMPNGDIVQAFDTADKA
ncbi:MAG: GNAT family N-acetyltransferase [Chloroflexota bacterium]|nr:GNAT family N-acetyltransferase [Chloroflexota bacterium]